MPVFKPNINYPVHIDEPLVVLDLRGHFEEHPETTMQGCIAKAFADAPNASA